MKAPINRAFRLVGNSVTVKKEKLFLRARKDCIDVLLPIAIKQNRAATFKFCLLPRIFVRNIW